MSLAPRLIASVVAVLGLTGFAIGEEKDSRLFELRVYYAAKGKLDALNARFRDHTVKLFEKHGMTNIGYWVPVDSPEDRLIYILAHKDRESAGKSWKAFIADPDWQKAYKDSEKDGKLVASAKNYFLTATDYTQMITPAKAQEDRLFELRTYVATPNNLDALNARFRDHTIKLFEKHGMTNVGYWTVAKDDKAKVGPLLTALSPVGQDKSGVDAEAAAVPVTLVYLLAHKTAEARMKSFAAFREDPVWMKARTESETKAGGSLTAKDGVKSLILKPTDYSPMK